MKHVIFFFLLFLIQTTSLFAQIRPLHECTLPGNRLTTAPASQNFNPLIFNGTLPEVLDQVFDSTTSRADSTDYRESVRSAPRQAQQRDAYLLRKNQFSLGLGVGYFMMTDFQFSPNMFQSIRPNVRLGYANKLKKGILSTNLQVFTGGLTPNSASALNFYIKETDINGVETVKLQEVELTQLGFNLELGYLHQISKLATTNTMLYIGGSLEESFTYTPGFLSIGTINYGSLNAKARFDYTLANSKSIIFGLSFPVVAVVTRFPYHNAPNYPGKSGIQGFFTDNNNLESFGHFQNFRFSAKYNLIVRKRLALDVTYEASWMHYSRPEHLTQFGNQLSLGLNF